MRNKVLDSDQPPHFPFCRLHCSGNGEGRIGTRRVQAALKRVQAVGSCTPGQLRKIIESSWFMRQGAQPNNDIRASLPVAHHQRKEAHTRRTHISCREHLRPGCVGGGAPTTSPPVAVRHPCAPFLPQLGLHAIYPAVCAFGVEWSGDADPGQTWWVREAHRLHHPCVCVSTQPP